MAEYIEFDRVSKAFPGQVALDDVSFSIRKGEIHAIIGENGAGKTTLLNILHGVFPATSGEVRIGGVAVHFRGIADANRFGIAKVHQEINTIPEMTVAQNLLLGSEPGRFGFVSGKAMYEKARAILDKLQCEFSPSAKMSSLTAGQKQMVAVSKALDSNAQVISFDEPTSSLSDTEGSILFNIIMDLKAAGITVLYISHKMDEVFRLCDRATVLQNGRFVNTFDIRNTTRDEVIQAMVGRDVSLFAKRMGPCRRDLNRPVLRVENLTGKGFADVSFTLYHGELLGLFGLVGAGRTEVMRALYGADRKYSGKASYEGRPLAVKSPHGAVRQGVALISENRKEEGVIPNLNNMDNIAQPVLERFRRYMMESNRAKAENSKRVGAAVGLTPNDPEFMTASLSGGNAQKVMLARWISTDSQLMIFDEPTKGIDIGAKVEIYKLMEEMLENGKSIIMVSSELTEIMGMSDRILVMHEGRISGELEREAFSEERILRYAMEGESA